jgi:hypothetical protein
MHAGRMWIVLALAGCPSDPPPECITVDTTCQPLYPATFQNVYDQTLKDGCGSERSACHSRIGHKGGMSFEDPDTAYQALMNGRVSPGDAACSELIVRTNSPGTDYQMPPGAALGEAEQCALVQWVHAGAPR